MSEIGYNIQAMRTKTSIVLVVLLLSLAAPFSLHISVSNDITILVTLDVCSAAGAALSVNADTTVIQERSCELVPPVFSGYALLPNPENYRSIFRSKEIRPPEA